MHSCWFFFFLLFTNILSEEVSEFIRVKSFENCHKENLVMTFHNFSVKQLNKEVYLMNVTVNFKEAMGPEVKGTFSGSYCKDENNPDSCEYLIRDYELGDVCEMISEEDTEWSDFVNAIKIPKKCPMGPGSYSAVNFHLKYLFKGKLPINPGFWKVRFQSYVKEVETGCCDLDIVIY